MQRFEFVVGEGDAKQRLDQWLASNLPDMSRSRLRQLIDEGHVTDAATGAAYAKASVKTRIGDCVVVCVHPAVDALPEPENIPLDIVYEDDDLVVVNKPAGMAVHPAAGTENGTLVNALLYHCGESLSGIGGVRRPGIVHRIDKDTSGLLVVAKNDIAHHGLAKQFEKHSVHRRYLALVWGYLTEKEGTIEGAIGRNPHHRKKMAVVEKGGKDAITHFTRQKLFGLIATLVECRLETGRTHQIRVHLSTNGYPLIGDPVYGRCPPNVRKRIPKELQTDILGFNRQALHAAELGFFHPSTGELLKFEKSFPKDYKRLIAILEKC